MLGLPPGRERNELRALFNRDAYAPKMPQEAMIQAHYGEILTLVLDLALEKGGEWNGME